MDKFVVIGEFRNVPEVEEGGFAKMFNVGLKGQVREKVRFCKISVGLHITCFSVVRP